ncbi:MAG: YqaJ viral recombinase family protein [Trueperaceae bacterium]|nr:YqaJ viral recombinase family protein [Trueperaceae bacterium]
MTLAPRSAAWHADRQATIGASDAPIITGDAPWGDLLTLYAVKAGIVDAPELDAPHVVWGLKLEAVVAEWYAETYGVKLRRDNTRPRHPDYPWMATSLDRRIVGENALVEIKTARFPTDEWGQQDTAEVPAHVLVQCQHEMAVTGADVCYVAVLFSGSDPRRYIVPRDPALIDSLIELEVDFMECVRTGTPPDAIIRRQRQPVEYRHDELEADETLARGIEGLYLLRQEIRGLKADEEKATEAVKTILGAHTAARAGEYRATYKQNADSRSVRWELVARAYRKWIEDDLESGKGIGIEDRERIAAIESLFTEDKPGLRLLRITKKEAPDA